MAKKKPAKKKPAKKKPAKKAPAKSSGDAKLQTLYLEETGKKALHCGKPTKAYTEWKKNH